MTVSKFAELVKKMREAQKAYNIKPTVENLNAMEDLEDEVDAEIDFIFNCHETTHAGVKKWLIENQYA